MTEKFITIKPKSPSVPGLAGSFILLCMGGAGVWGAWGLIFSMGLWLTLACMTEELKQGSR